ncbi:MAG: hypothetical protein JST48_10275 [Bacteroidetes bacterium]|nr:hypothetical protein [Bacteroidota bacterium]
MKKTAVLLILLITSTCFSFAKPRNESEHKILSVKNHALYFKVDKSFIGGTVEIYNAHNKLVGEETLTSTHTTLDFINIPMGNYTIKVKKVNNIILFNYSNPFKS